MAGDTAEHITAMGESQEYSFRAFLEEYTINDNGGYNIKKARVVEVSPVMVGAGNDTGTLSIKKQFEMLGVTDPASGIQIESPDKLDSESATCYNKIAQVLLLTG